MILAILQARVSSTRLPGKVMKTILGVPMLLRQIERVKRSQLINGLVIATSKDDSDNIIEKLCQENGIACYRGSLDDVLDRFYKASFAYHPDHVVRLTGDCPLIDPQVIDEVITYYLQGRYDYASNALNPTYPDGLDVEIFSFACLQLAWQEAKLPSQREHVTPFLHQQPERFKLGSYKNSKDLSDLRWTVDESADFALVSRIYELLYPQNPFFNTEDILRLLDENIDINSMNMGIKRNEGYQKSLRLDI